MAASTPGKQRPVPERRGVVLVVEDHRATAHVIAEGLRLEGYEVTIVGTAKAARQHLDTQRCDVIVLDRILPDNPGLQFCTELSHTAATPIIMISGVGSPADRVEGLDAGADDYLQKPLHVSELRARIDAVLRRASAGPQSAAISGPHGLELDLRANEIARDGARAQLTRSETSLLRILLEHLGTVWTTDELAQRAWGYDTAGDANFVQLHVSRLRRKLTSVGMPKDFVRTVYGVGYATTAAALATQQ